MFLARNFKKVNQKTIKSSNIISLSSKSFEVENTFQSFIMGLFIKDVTAKVKFSNLFNINLNRNTRLHPKAKTSFINGPNYKKFSTKILKTTK